MKFSLIFLVLISSFTLISQEEKKTPPKPRIANSYHCKVDVLFDGQNDIEASGWAFKDGENICFVLSLPKTKGVVNFDGFLLEFPDSDKKKSSAFFKYSESFFSDNVILFVPTDYENVTDLLKELEFPRRGGRLGHPAMDETPRIRLRFNNVVIKG